MCFALTFLFDAEICNYDDKSEVLPGGDDFSVSKPWIHYSTFYVPQLGHLILGLREAVYLRNYFCFANDLRFCGSRKTLLWQRSDKKMENCAGRCQYAFLDAVTIGLTIILPPCTFTLPLARRELRILHLERNFCCTNLLMVQILALQFGKENE